MGRTPSFMFGGPADAQVSARQAGRLVGYFVGFALIPSIVLVGVFGWATRKRYAPWVGIAGSIVLLATAAVASAMKYGRIERQSKELRELVENAATPGYFVSGAETNSIEALEREISALPAPARDLGELLRQVRAHPEALSRIYLMRIEECGWSGFFDADRLSRDEGFTETRRMMTNIATALAMHRSRVEASPDRTRKLVERSKLSSLDKRNFLGGASASSDATMPWTLRSLDKEREILDEAFRGMGLLMENTDGWEVVDGDLAFSDEALEAEIGGMYRMIAVLTEEQEKIGKRLIAVLNEQRSKAGLPPAKTEATAGE